MEFEKQIMLWADMSRDNLSASEHEERAEAYEKQAAHYEDLAKEARKLAATHRDLAKNK